jgi:hypothetical protein
MGMRPPKDSQKGAPQRSIISNIGAPNYQLSKHLTGMLSQSVGCYASCENLHTMHSHLGFSTHLTGGLHGQLQHGVLFITLPFREAQNLFRQHFEEDKLGLF